MGKNNTHIYSGLEFETTKLTKMNKFVWSCIELKSFSYDFLNELAHYIEKDNWPKYFGQIVRFFVWFRDDYCGRYFEMRRPIS